MGPFASLLRSVPPLGPLLLEHEANRENERCVYASKSCMGLMKIARGMSQAVALPTLVVFRRRRDAPQLSARPRTTSACRLRPSAIRSGTLEEDEARHPSPEPHHAQRRRRPRWGTQLLARLGPAAAGSTSRRSREIDRSGAGRACGTLRINEPRTAARLLLARRRAPGAGPGYPWTCRSISSRTGRLVDIVAEGFDAAASGSARLSRRTWSPCASAACRPLPRGRRAGVPRRPGRRAEGPRRSRRTRVHPSSACRAASCSGGSSSDTGSR